MQQGDELAKAILGEIENLEEPTPDATTDIVERHAQPPSSTAKPPFTGWIDSIELQGVRAFGPRQTLELSRGLTIVYAENGSGKTSIIDGVELLVNGRTTRANQFPAIEGEVKDSDHVPHADSAGKTTEYGPQVTALWYNSGEAQPSKTEWSGQWSSPASDTPPAQLFARRRLREAISLKGSERTERLGVSLGLGQLIETWTAARTSLEDAAKQESPQPDDDIALAVEQWRSSTPTQSVEELAELIHSSALTDIGDGSTDPQEPSSSETPAYKQPVPSPPYLPTTAPLRGLLPEWEEHAATEPPTPPEGLSAEILDTLRAFRQVAEPGSRCFACEQGQVTPERLKAIDQVLGAAARYEEHRNVTADLGARTDGVLADLQSYTLTWNIAERDFPVDIDPDADDTLARFYRNCTAIRTKSADWNDAVAELHQQLLAAHSTPTPKVIREVLNSADKLTNMRSDCENLSLQAERSRLEAHSEHSSKHQTALQQAELRRDNASRIARAVKRIHEHENKCSIRKQAARELKNRLDTAINEKCKELAAPINDWLNLLAPDETPAVRVETRASAGRPTLHLLVAEGKVTAVGRLSDSQLDMLGLAAHLATLEREFPGAPIFIDDPTDMLDHVTRGKFAGHGIKRLLGGDNDCKSGHQIVLLTHDNDLVRMLWRHYGLRHPCTVQHSIDLVAESNPPYAEIRPRSAAQYLRRVRDLLRAHHTETHRLWLRNSAGNHTRQALELVVKGVLEVLGRPGHGYLVDRLSETENDQKPGLGTLINESLDPALEKIEYIHSECGADRHRSSGYAIAKLRDCLARHKDYMLNEASHADFVYPSVARIKEYVTELEGLAERLEPHGPGRTDDLPRSSRWYHELTLCAQCQPFPAEVQ